MMSKNEATIYAFGLFTTILTASTVSIALWTLSMAIGWKLILFILSNAIVMTTGLGVIGLQMDNNK